MIAEAVTSMTTPQASRTERPASGIGHYLRDLVYGANDGVITTFAVVAGVTGASLAASVALILGLANLLGDGLSMGAGNYLSLKSELEQTGRSVEEEQPARHGWATFGAFVVAGGIPLLAYVPAVGLPVPRFVVAGVLGFATLAVVGASRAPFVKRSPWICGLEMVVVGGLAAVAAYLTGFLAHLVA